MIPNDVNRSSKFTQTEKKLHGIAFKIIANHPALRRMPIAKRMAWIQGFINGVAFERKRIVDVEYKTWWNRLLYRLMVGK